MLRDVWNIQNVIRDAQNLAVVEFVKLPQTYSINKRFNHIDLSTTTHNTDYMFMTWTEGSFSWQMQLILRSHEKQRAFQAQLELANRKPKPQHFWQFIP